MKQLSIVILILALLMGCTSCGTEPQEEAPSLAEPAGVKQDVTRVTRGDLAKFTCYEAVVVPDYQELSLKAGGTVSRVNCNPGDRVTEGQLLLAVDEESTEEQLASLEEQLEMNRTLYELDNRQTQAELDSLVIELKALYSTYAGQELTAAQIKKIALKKLDIEDKQLELAQTEENQSFTLSRLERQLEKARTAAEDKRLVAPFSGVVVKRESMLVGDRLEAGKTMVILADPAKLTVRCDGVNPLLLQNALSFTGEIGGVSFPLTIKPYSQQEYMALVLKTDSIPPAVFSFDSLPEGVAPKAGDFVLIKALEKEVRDTLKLPAGAVLNDSQGAYVYVVAENGGRSVRRVKKGLSTAVETEILEGLQEGEAVYCGEAFSAEGAGGKLVQAENGVFAEQANGSATEYFPQGCGVLFEGVSSELVSLEVNRGDKVTQGQVLARLEPVASKVSLTEARIALQRNRESYEESRAAKEETLEALKAKRAAWGPMDITNLALMDQEILRQEAALSAYILQTESSLAKQAASLEEQEAAFAQTELVAPISGTVSWIKSVAAGTTVSSGTRLMEITSEVGKLLVLEDRNGYFRYNMPVTVTLGSGRNGEEVSGRVVAAVNMLPGSSKGTSVYIRLDEETSASTAKASVSALRITGKGVVIPRRAMQLDAGKYYVLKLEDGVARKRFVNAAVQGNDQAWIIQGLEDGDWLLLE